MGKCLEFGMNGAYYCQRLIVRQSFAIRFVIPQPLWPSTQRLASQTQLRYYYRDRFTVRDAFDSKFLELGRI